MGQYTYAEALALISREKDHVVERGRKIVRRTVKMVAPRIIQGLISRDPRPPVDRSTYRREWHFDDTREGASVYNSSPHAGVIEYGRRPGARMPPLAAIEAWVHRKGLVLGVTKKGKRRRLSSRLTPSQISGYQAQVRRVAWLIARSIARRGLPAHLILETAAKHIDVEIRRALAREL